MKYINRYYGSICFVLLFFVIAGTISTIIFGIFPLIILICLCFQWHKDYKILDKGFKCDALIVEYDDGTWTMNNVKELALICMYFDGDYKIVKVPTLQTSETPYGKSRFVCISVLDGEARLVDRRSYETPENISDYDAIGIWHKAYGNDEPPAWLI